MAIFQGLEIHDPTTGVLLNNVTDHYDGEWTQAVNVADMLTFSVPEDEAPASLILDNEVWLRRGDTADLARVFVITKIERTRGFKNYYTVTAMDPLILLARTAIEEWPVYEEGEEPETLNVAQFLQDVMGMQDVITWGTLPTSSADVAYDLLHVTNTTVLGAIQKARELIGGMVWVDNNKQLHWYETTRWADPDSYAFSFTTNTIETRYIQDKATGEIEYTYEVGIVDLSAHGDPDAGMLNIGMPVAFPVDDSTTKTVYITEIRQRLDSPLDCTVSVSDQIDVSGRPDDVLDAIMENIDQTVASAVSAATAITYGENDDIQTIGSENSAGTLSKVARADHVHEGVQPGDNIQPTGETNDQGTANTYARTNHVHRVVFGTDVQSVAQANAAGTGGFPARADHVHADAFAAITTVETLPPIPTFGARIVFWSSSGTGDDQIWVAWEGGTQWYPMSGVLTDNSGAV